MTREEATVVLKKLKAHYGDSTRVLEALDVAIDDMKYCDEVDKYGSELAMMIAHKEQYDADKKKLDEEFKELQEYVKKMKEDRT